MSERIRRFRRVALAATAVVAFAAPAAAESLVEALAQAYRTNPTLQAARAQLQATNQLVPQALAGVKPQVEASANLGLSYFDSNQARNSTERTLGGAQVQIQQPLYAAGVEPATRLAVARIAIARAQLDSVEQSVLLDAATAYLDILRDRALVELNQSNVSVLQRQFQAVETRFQVGEATRTEVSLARSRVARAQAALVQAEGALRAARAAYERVVGAPIVDVEPPAIALPLPESAEAAILAASTDNPAVDAAEFGVEAAQASVEIADAQDSPSAALVGSASKDYERAWGRDSEWSTRASVVAQVRVPLYQGGLVEARVAEAEEVVTQRREELDAARRQATQAAVQAWEAYQTARVAIEALNVQVEAARLALQGIIEEQEVGARTLLDRLDTEQELLDAQTELVLAQRNELVAAFQLTAAIGLLQAPALDLPVDYYDPSAHLRTLDTQWLFGIGVDPADIP